MRRVVGFAIALGLCCLSPAQTAIGPAPGSVEITAEPMHKLVLENEYVRVFEVEVPPNETTLVHRHERPYVWVSIGDAEVVSESPGKDPVAVHAKNGEVKFTPAGLVHKAKNVGSTTFRNVTVELKHVHTGGTLGGIIVTSGRDVPQQFVDNDYGCLAANYTLKPDGMASSLGGDHLLIAVTDVALRREFVRTPNELVRVKAGSVKWMKGSGRDELVNDGAATLRFVLLQCSQ